jgi:L-aspartate oxidase
MTRGAGVLRSAGSLEATRRELGSVWIADSGTDSAELRNLVTVAYALLDAALAREESRGCHTREDFPEPRDDFRHRLLL